MKTKLDERLLSVASFVRKNSVVADIGTDHGYVLAYLFEKNIILKAIAADLRKGPLENARKTISSLSFGDRTEFVLSDGLEKIKENSCDDIILAGMGGILIAEILEKAPWVKNENIRIIAQPMTHGEILRKFLFENGFEIIEEKVTTDGKRLYCTICAEYINKIEAYTEGETYIGKPPYKSDKLSVAYRNKILETLTKKKTALHSAGISDGGLLEKTIEEIEMLTGGKYD